MTIMPKVIMIFIFSSCQLNKQEVTTAKVSNVPSKKIVIEKENKKHIRKATISINKDIEVYSIEKQNSLGYKVVVNEKECKFVFSLEYFLQQKAKQNRKLDLQEIKLNIGFYF